MADEISNLLNQVGGGAEICMNEDGEVKSSQVYESKVIAKLFNVTVRRIQQLTQEGVLDTVSVMDGKRELRRYELVPTIRKYIAYLSDKAYGKQSATAKERSLKERKMAAEADLKESQTELHKLRTKIATGEYISKEQVKLDYSRFFVAFKNMAMSIPSICSGRVSAYVDPTEARRLEKDLAEDISKLLSSFVAAGVSPGDIEEVPEEEKTVNKRGRKKKESPPTEDQN